MSKELEALINNSKNIVDKYEEFAIGEIKKFADKNDWSLKLMHSFIEKTLTPPTSEQLCKELSEYLGKTVVYDRKFKTIFVKVPMGNLPLVRLEEDCLVFNTLYWFPPHLITLIGRFYESLEGK